MVSALLGPVFILFVRSCIVWHGNGVPDASSRKTDLSASVSLSASVTEGPNGAALNVSLRLVVE